MASAFPQNLRRLRERRRISRRVLSELCGLSKNMIAQYEQGQRCPSVKNLEILAGFFDVTMDELWNRKK